MEMKDPIKEAQRYIDNAKTLLKEKAMLDPKLGMYEDSKYVKLAGHALWTGAIIALKYSLNLKLKPRQRIDIDFIKEAASKRNKTLVKYIVEHYNLAHLYMGYDGSKSKNIAKEAIAYTQHIVDWCAENRPAS